jgi:DNA repair protein RecO (recombination protein O)
MIEKSSSEHDLKILLSGLKLVGDYLEKTILKPNDINHPISRLNFINTLK